MVRRDPPDTCPSARGPATTILRAGSVLWRVHSGRWKPTAWNDTPYANRKQHGRFDSPTDAYWALYAANDERTTFAEALLRGDTVTGATRSLPHKAIEGVVLSQVHVRSDLTIVSLVGGTHLSRVGQDAWLTSCDENDYAITQRYASSIRDWAPDDVAGMVWVSKRDNTRRAYVLFSDRVSAGELEDGASRPLDDPSDPYAKLMLARLSVSLEDLVP